MLQKTEGVKSGSAVKSPFTPFRDKNIAENRQKSKVTLVIRCTRVLEFFGKSR